LSRFRQLRSAICACKTHSHAPKLQYDFYTGNTVAEASELCVSLI
jgi:hypothetical protein